MRFKAETVAELVECWERNASGGVAGRQLRGGGGDAGLTAAVVVKLAAELGFAADRPPLPRLKGGEKVLEAAIRLFDLKAPAAALAKHKRADELADDADAQLERLQEDYFEARRGELVARAKAVEAGKLPPLPSRADIERMRDTIAALHLVGLEPGVRGVWPSRSRVPVYEEQRGAVEPADWPAVVLYAYLVVKRLENLTLLDHYSSESAQLRTVAGIEVVALSKFATQGAGCRDNPELAMLSRQCAWAAQEAGTVFGHQENREAEQAAMLEAEAIA